MGAAKKAMDKTPRTKAIPTIIFILLLIICHLRSFAHKKAMVFVWFRCLV